VFDGVHAVQRNDLNRREADNFSIGWNNVIALNDKVNLVVDASWSKAERTDFLLETYSGAGYARSGPDDRVTVTQQENGTFKIVPTLDYSDTSIFSITDPQGWGYNGTTAVVQAGFLNEPNFKDDLKSLRASLEGEYDNAFLKGWEVGANYTRRKKTSAFKSYFLCPAGAGTNCTVASGTPTSVPVPAGAILDEKVSLDYLGVPQMLTLDPEYLYDNTLKAVFDNRPVSLVRDNTVTEDIFTGYVKVKIDGTIADAPLRGSLGFQMVVSKQISEGTGSNFNSTTGVVTVIPLDDSANYTNLLPSLALAYEALPNTYVKFGASRTMVRARLDQLRVNQELNINFGNLGSTDPNNSVFSSNSGNTQLRPYISDNLDLSIERYFERGGYVALAGYYKNLSDFVNPSVGVLTDFSFMLPLLSPEAQALVGTTDGVARKPLNSGSGHLKGFEATLSLPFSNFSDSLEGFGFFGSGSYTYSSIRYDGQTDPITLPGLSDWVASGEVYYERFGFQARMSYRYRSQFLGEVSGLSANPTFREVKAEGILDAQIGYEFQDGPLEGLAVLLQGKNLTDRPFITFENGDPRRVIDYQRYGRDYYLGVSYKF
jgi:iron complex outermembrane receptor protein